MKKVVFLMAMCLFATNAKADSVELQPCFIDVMAKGLDFKFPVLRLILHRDGSEWQNDEKKMGGIVDRRDVYMFAKENNGIEMIGTTSISSDNKTFDNVIFTEERSEIVFKLPGAKGGPITTAILSFGKIDRGNSEGTWDYADEGILQIGVGKKLASKKVNVGVAKKCVLEK